MQGQYFFNIEDEKLETQVPHPVFSSVAEMKRAVWNGIQRFYNEKNDESGIIYFH